MNQDSLADAYARLHESDGTADVRSPFDRVYRGVLRGIFEGRFAPGQRLLAPDLMERFDVGRGTVREVLNRLGSSGIVTMVPNRGAKVRTLSRQETLGILDIVQLLLGLAARGAAKAAADTGMAHRLQELDQAVRNHEPLHDFEGFLEAREAYYRFIIEISGNSELKRLFPTVQVQIMRIQLRNFGRAADAVQLDSYTSMTEAILSGETDRAESAARLHVDGTIRRVTELPDKAFSKPA